MGGRGFWRVLRFAEANLLLKFILPVNDINVHFGDGVSLRAYCSIIRLNPCWSAS